VIRLDAALAAIVLTFGLDIMGWNPVSVMVIDTEKEIRDKICLHLQKPGFQVSAVKSPEEAVALATRLTFNLVIADVFLPGMRGKDLVRKISDVQPSVKVLFTSAYSRSVLLHSGSCPIGSALLTKPFSKEELMEKVRMVLDYHRRWLDQIRSAERALQHETTVPLDDFLAPSS
jgi:DNA-binding response OmpR family regulator